MNPAILSLQRPFITPPPPLPLTSYQNHLSQSLTLAPIRSSSGGGNGGETINNDGSGSGNAAAPIPPPMSQPDGVQIRFKRGSRKRRKQGLDEEGQEPQKVKAAAPKKEWESMTVSERAVELYMGEKGLLFWLNKFAYASIFIVIGGWIVFRFVGPALNLYQLDAPPLEPTAILKGSGK